MAGDVWFRGKMRRLWQHLASSLALGANFEFQNLDETFLDEASSDEASSDETSLDENTGPRLGQNDEQR